MVSTNAKTTHARFGAARNSRSVDAADMAAERLASLLAAVVDGSSDAIVTTSLDGTILSWNPAAERLFGFSAMEAIGEQIAILAPAGEADVVTKAIGLIGSETEPIHLEVARMRRDCKAVTVAATISAVRNERGYTHAAAVAARDVSEERRLREVLARRNRQLEEANRRLRELDTFKSNLLTMASHELRTPLTATLGYTEYIGSAWDRVDDDTKRNAFSVVEAQSRRLVRLVRVMELAAAVEAGAIGEETAAVEVRAAVDAACRDLDAPPDVDIDIDVADGLRVAMDMTHLQTLVSTLLVNAVVHGRPPIRVSAEASDRSVVVRVTDRGSGLDHDAADALFDEFATVSICRAKGLGLSLSVVRQVARSYGGDAWYERTNGTTTFALRLPS